MYLQRKVYPKSFSLIPAQQVKSFLRLGTKPVLVIAPLREPNPAPHDAPLVDHAETPNERNKRLRSRYGTVKKYLKIELK